MLNLNGGTKEWGEKHPGVVFMSLSGIWLYATGYGYVICGLCLRACSRLEIMEQMAVLQETSYEQLYRWAQSEYSTRVDTTSTLRDKIDCDRCCLRPPYWTWTCVVLSEADNQTSTFCRNEWLKIINHVLWLQNVAAVGWFVSVAFIYLFIHWLELNTKLWSLKWE